MFKKIIISAIMFLLFPVLAHAETASTDSIETIKQNISIFVAKNNIPAAAVQIYRDGKLQTMYLGDAKPTTQFEIGSLGEILTGLLFAQQVDAAKVQLTTPVKQFFPNATDAFANITLRSLATSTSGLPANAAANHTSDTPISPVDENWLPSTIGMTMLTKALETVTHKNIAELYQKQIFSVLGMSSAKASPTELKVTATDMQKFLAAAIGLPGIPESVMYPMRLTQTAFIELNDRMIGLGWQIRSKEETNTVEDAQANDDSVKDVPTRPVYKADREYDKSASNAYIAVLPNKKSGVVILLSTKVNEDALSDLGRQLLAELST